MPTDASAESKLNAMSNFDAIIDPEITLKLLLF